MHLQHPHSLQVLSCASLGEDIRIVKLSKESISELGKLSQRQRLGQSVSDLLPCGDVRCTTHAWRPWTKDTGTAPLVEHSRALTFTDIH